MAHHRKLAQTKPVKKQDDNASENQLPVEIWIQNRFFLLKWVVGILHLFDSTNFQKKW